MHDLDHCHPCLNDFHIHNWPRSLSWNSTPRLLLNSYAWLSHTPLWQHFQSWIPHPLWNYTFCSAYSSGASICILENWVPSSVVPSSSFISFCWLSLPLKDLLNLSPPLQLCGVIWTRLSPFSGLPELLPVFPCPVSHAPHHQTDLSEIHIPRGMTFLNWVIKLSLCFNAFHD
jgi:hypothetical protein